jgi:hypothetical protein
MRSQRRFASSLRRGDQTLVAIRVGAAQRAGVRLRPDGHDRVHRLYLGPRDRGHEGQLLLVRFGEHELRQALELEVDVGMRPDRERGAVNLDHERAGHGRGVDPQHLAGLESERVGDDQLG